MMNLSKKKDFEVVVLAREREENTPRYPSESQLDFSFLGGFCLVV